MCAAKHRPPRWMESKLPVCSHERDLQMSRSPFQIVLVEDTEWEVFLIREALKQAGLAFELDILDDGEKALELIAKIESDETAPLPRLIMLDLNLPKVS